MSKETEVFDFVYEYIVEHNGRSPSLDQIAAACDIVKSHAKFIVGKLVKNKVLQQEEGARGIRIPNSKLIVE